MARWTALCCCVLLSEGSASEDLSRALLRAWRAGRPEVLIEVLGRAGSAPSARSLRMILRLGVETRSEEVYRAVRAALSRIRSLEAVRELGKVAGGSGDFRYRALCIFALGDIQVSATEAYLVPLLKHKDLRIRLRTAEALGRKPSRRTVGALIASLKEADQRSPELSYAVRRSLAELTGLNLKSAGDWEKWWQTVREHWQPFSEGTSGRTSPAGVRPPGRFPTFFEIEIVSLRCVFVIDVSGSMKEYVERTTVPKIQAVKRELCRLIGELHAKTHFGIVAFSDTIRPLSKKLLPATPPNRARAIRFVKDLTAGGYTWTKEALQSAFSDPTANTIVLLSDGTPCKKNQGRIPTKPIIRWVAWVNRFRRATIHCVGFRGAYTPFLRTLALENGGIYRYARLPSAQVRRRQRPLLRSR